MVLAEYKSMRRKRISWSSKDLDYHDVDKYFEFFDLNLRQYYVDVVNAIHGPKNIEGRVLDLGCGFGILGMMICSRDEFSTVTGLEPSRTLVRSAEVISSRRGYTGRISFKVWQDDKFPFADGEFDAIVSFLSLNQWNNPEKILREIERVRKKDSIVYISDFRRDQPAISSRLFIQQVRFEMGKEIAEKLKKSFNSSYTADEIKQLLSGINLPGYRLEENKTFINIISGLPAIEEKPADSLEENTESKEAENQSA
jgi:ubiquinone/menaquinone biosynthesis C-methylase UbiE